MPSLVVTCKAPRTGRDAALEHTVFPQGIDLEAGGRNKKVRRTAPKSENVYLKLLVKVMAAAPK